MTPGDEKHIHATLHFPWIVLLDRYFSVFDMPDPRIHLFINFALRKMVYQFHELSRNAS